MKNLLLTLLVLIPIQAEATGCIVDEFTVDSFYKKAIAEQRSADPATVQKNVKRWWNYLWPFPLFKRSVTTVSPRPEMQERRPDQVGENNPVFQNGKSAGTFSHYMSNGQYFSYRGLNRKLFGQFQSVQNRGTHGNLGATFSTTITPKGMENFQIKMNVEVQTTTQRGGNVVGEFYHYTQPVESFYVSFEILGSRQNGVPEFLNERGRTALYIVRQLYGNSFYSGNIFRPNRFDANRYASKTEKDITFTDITQKLEIKRDIYGRQELTESEAFIALLRDVLSMSPENFQAMMRELRDQQLPGNSE